MVKFFSRFLVFFSIFFIGCWGGKDVDYKPISFDAYVETVKERESKVAASAFILQSIEFGNENEKFIVKYFSGNILDALPKPQSKDIKQAEKIYKSLVENDKERFVKLNNEYRDKIKDINENSIILYNNVAKLLDPKEEKEYQAKIEKEIRQDEAKQNALHLTNFIGVILVVLGLGRSILGKYIGLSVGSKILPKESVILFVVAFCLFTFPWLMPAIFESAQFAYLLWACLVFVIGYVIYLIASSVFKEKSGELTKEALTTLIINNKALASAYPELEEITNQNIAAIELKGEENVMKKIDISSKEIQDDIREATLRFLKFKNEQKETKINDNKQQRSSSIGVDAETQVDSKSN